MYDLNFMPWRERQQLEQRQMIAFQIISGAFVAILFGISATLCLQHYQTQLNVKLTTLTQQLHEQQAATQQPPSKSDDTSLSATPALTWSILAAKQRTLLTTLAHLTTEMPLSMSLQSLALTNAGYTIIGTAAILPELWHYASYLQQTFHAPTTVKLDALGAAFTFTITIMTHDLNTLA